jgi:hypothetical protein
MTKAEVYLKNIITSAVAEAVTNAVKPLIDMIHRQGETIFIIFILLLTMSTMILSVLCLCLLLGHCGNGVMFFFHTALAPPRQDQSQSLIEKETVFKTQGQSYNMDDLIKSTLLKEPVLESIVPNIYEKVMTKAEVYLKNIITSAVAEAVLIGTLWKRSDALLPYCSSSSICSLRCITSLRKFALSCLSVVLSCCRHVIVSPCLCIMSINGFTAFVTAYQ